MITQERLKEVFDYNPKIGYFISKVKRGGYRVGQKAGAPNGGNYYLILQIDGVPYKAHRLAWLFVHGEHPPEGMFVDHRNGIRQDNRIENLRLATRSENARNAKRPSSNRSGFKGVSFSRNSNKFQAFIHLSGKNKHLGYFETAESAARAYADAARQHYGEFARTV